MFFCPKCRIKCGKRCSFCSTYRAKVIGQGTEKIEPCETEKDIKSAYELTINARNFHYDNFSKWMTFYYVAVGAIFIGFYKATDYKSLLAFLGFVTSVFWHLSCKGYYFWIKNWIMLLQRFKNETVYTIFSKSVKETQNRLGNPIQSANISTSKLTLAFSFFISWVWCWVWLVETGSQISHFVSWTGKPQCGLLFDCPLTLLIVNFVAFIIALMLTYVLIILIGRVVPSDLTHHKMV